MTEGAGSSTETKSISEQIEDARDPYAPRPEVRRQIEEVSILNDQQIFEFLKIGSVNQMVICLMKQSSISYE